MLLLISRSSLDRCARKISRFARNDDMGEETLRRVGFLHDCCVAPWRRGAPKAEDRLPRRGSLLRVRMKSHVRSPVLAYRHPERSRGIFFVVAVLCTYAVMIKSRGCFGCSSADALRLTVVRGRFLAALEMTRGGRIVIRGRAFSLLAFPTFSAKRSHSLRKERLRDHHSPPILSAFSHRLAPRGSLMDFFKNKRVSPHFLQI